MDASQSGAIPARTAWVLKNPRILLLLIVAGAVLFRLYRLDGNLDDYDTWRQTDTASIARLFLDEPNIFYPRVYWGAPGPGYVETEFQLYTWLISCFYRVAGERPIIGRIASILFSAAACFVLFILARRYLDDRYSLIAVLIFTLSPLEFRYSRAFMPDSLVLLLYLLALERFLVFLDSEKTPVLMMSAVWMALAILVKPTSIHLGLLFIILRVAKKGWRPLFRPGLLAFAAITLLPCAAYYAHAAAIHREYGNTFGVLSGGDSKWGSPELWFGLDFYGQLLAMDMTWIAGPIGAVLAVIGMVSLRKADWSLLIWTWAIVIMVYYMITGRYSGFARGLQYHIYTAPVVSLAAAAGIAVLAAKMRSIPAALACLGMVLLVCGYQIWGDWRLLNSQNILQREAGLALAEVSDPEDLILVLSHDSARYGRTPNNFQEPDVFYHARRWGRSLGRDQQSPARLEQALFFGPRWFVNFTEVNRVAAHGFLELLHSRASPVQSGPGYEIYRFNDSNASDIIPAATDTAIP